VVCQQIDTPLSRTQLRTTPEAYKDRIVMLGGDILSACNLAEGTLAASTSPRGIGKAANLPLSQFLGAGTVCRYRLSGRQTEDLGAIAHGGSRAHMR
jgi:hypothetical protein